MKIILLTILLIILNNCSFDNKTGIWQNNNTTITDIRFDDFETLYSKEQSFNKIITPKKNLDIPTSKTKINLKWVDEFYQNTNNTDNFNYQDQNQLIFKSKKLSRYKIREKLLHDGKNIITTDIKGNIIIYSFDNKKIIFKYNFYKKKFKKNKKFLNTIINDDILYVSDNFGYLYAIDYSNGNLIWAKNYKIPFRSNIKIYKNKIFLANINNDLFLINKINGERLKSFPTEQTTIKNDFINSLAIKDDNIFYLNTYGSFYSINSKGRINWFVNINESLDISTNNVFYSNPLFLVDEKIFVSTNSFLYILNADNGFILNKISISSILKPIVIGKNLFLITKNNLLVCININTGKIIYSIDISKEIANLLSSKNKSITIESFSILNNNLFIFLNNSYLVKFNLNGKILKIDKLPSKLETYPVFIDGTIIYLNKKNQLIVFN